MAMNASLDKSYSPSVAHMAIPIARLKRFDKHVNACAEGYMMLINETSPEQHKHACQGVIWNIVPFLHSISSILPIAGLQEILARQVNHSTRTHPNRFLIALQRGEL
jgi:hypothetical protein